MLSHPIAFLFSLSSVHAFRCHGVGNTCAMNLTFDEPLPAEADWPKDGQAANITHLTRCSAMVSMDYLARKSSISFRRDLPGDFSYILSPLIGVHTSLEADYTMGIVCHSSFSFFTVIVDVLSAWLSRSSCPVSQKISARARKFVKCFPSSILWKAARQPLTLFFRNGWLNHRHRSRWNSRNCLASRAIAIQIRSVRKKPRLVVW